MRVTLFLSSLLPNPRHRRLHVFIFMRCIYFLFDIGGLCISMVCILFTALASEMFKISLKLFKLVLVRSISIFLQDAVQRHILWDLPHALQKRPAKQHYK